MLVGAIHPCRFDELHFKNFWFSRTSIISRLSEFKVFAGIQKEAAPHQMNQDEEKDAVLIACLPHQVGHCHCYLLPLLLLPLSPFGTQSHSI